MLILTSIQPMILTSDAPVCREYPETANLPAGVINPDLTIYFPISARRVLMFQHDQKKHERAEQWLRGETNLSASDRADIPSVAYC
jgi:hypothetical protein